MKISNFKFQIILPILIVFAAGFVLWSNFNKPVSADWYNTLWQYRQKITIDKTKVGGGAENETNFPVLVSITEPKLIKGAQASGNDIMFTDSDGITKLSHEIESYNSTTGQLIAWVKVPTLTYQTNNVLYMYYGSASAPSQQNATDVWSNSYSGVWHLPNGSTLSALDSTSNARNGTIVNATATTGKIDGAGSFNGSSRISIGNLGNIPSAGVISFWMNPAVMANYNNALDTDNNGNAGIRFEEDSTGKFAVIIAYQGSSDIHNYLASGLAINMWRKVTLVWNTSANTVVGYLDGTQVFSEAQMHWPTTLPNVFLGTGYSAGRSWNGLLDEVRISSTVRSAGWISTEYNNQNSPSTFLTLSSTQEKSKAPVLNWKFDEGLGTTVNDSSVNKTSANLNSPINLPTWQTEDQCLSGKCLYFEGSNASASATVTLPNIQTVSLWTKPASSSGTIPFVSFSSGTGTIAISSTNLAVTTSGITSPTVYVNGKSSTTLISNQWNHIEVTTGTSFTATNPVLGKVHTTFFKGYIDEFKIYDYARSAAEVKSDYNAGSVKSAPTQTGLSNGLVGYWKMDESSGSAIDSSGNGNTGTWNGTGANHYTSGKFGNGGGFNGSDDYISSGASIPSLTGTVSYWVNRQATTGDVIYAGTGYNDFTTYTISNGSTIFGFFIGSNYTTSTATTIPLNTWTHVVVRWGSSGTQAFFNGVQVASNSTPPPAFNQTGINIGRRNNNTYYTTGSIDEVRIYNRALSASEVSQLYNYAPGPTKYYRLEKTTDDATTNGNPVYAPGKFGSGLKLNGSGQSLQVPAF